MLITLNNTIERRNVTSIQKISLFYKINKKSKNMHVFKKLFIFENVIWVIYPLHILHSIRKYTITVSNHSCRKKKELKKKFWKYFNLILKDATLLKRQNYVNFIILKYSLYLHDIQEFVIFFHYSIFRNKKK